MRVFLKVMLTFLSTLGDIVLYAIIATIVALMCIYPVDSESYDGIESPNEFNLYGLDRR